MIANGLKSPSLWCRWWGCIGYVPARGYYPGLPQSHCYDCGTRQCGAMEGCPDWKEPHDPTLWTWLGHALVKLEDRIDAWRRVEKLERDQ